MRRRAGERFWRAGGPSGVCNARLRSMTANLHDPTPVWTLTLLRVLKFPPPPLPPLVLAHPAPVDSAARIQAEGSREGFPKRWLTCGLVQTCGRGE